MNHKNIFTNDLLALALACVVSLMFTIAITQFNNPTQKKVGESVCVVITGEKAIANSFSMLREDAHRLHHPIENLQGVDSGVSLTNIFTYKGIRFVILDLSSHWELSTLAKIQCYNSWHRVPYKLWSPSIPIALRRLLI